MTFVEDVSLCWFERISAAKSVFACGVPQQWHYHGPCSCKGDVSPRKSQVSLVVSCKKVQLRSAKDI